MTPSSDPTPPDSNGNDAADKRRKRLLLYGGGALVVVVVVLFAGWYFILRDTSPPSVTSAEQAEARDAAIADATDSEPEALPTADATPEATAIADEPEAPLTPDAGDEADEPETLPTADDTAEADGPETAAGLDGTWTIDTTIGSFDDFSSAFVGFRIDEELASIGAKTVVGRTPDVSGTLELEGATVTATEIVVDMTTLTTDSAQRNGQLRRQAIETSTFPEGMFVLTQPMDLGELPADGGSVETTATGDLTIHGVTQSVDIPLTAELKSGVIVVFGELNLVLEDYGIAQPQAAVVLSVGDNADLELQLFFTR